MKVAIATEGQDVCQHFGMSPSFTVVEIHDGQVVQKTVQPNPGPHNHGLLADHFLNQGVTTVVVGGIGLGAREALASGGMSIIPGVSGSVDDVIQQLIAGTLEPGDSVCDHDHGQHHHHHDHFGDRHHHHHEHCGGHRGFRRHRGLFPREVR